MGDHFNVEVQDLDRLLQQLHDSQDDMRKALGALKDVGPKSTGSEALDNACDEFHDSWDNAIKKIADGTEHIEEKLRATKDNYAATEQAIRDAMTTKGVEAQPSPSPSPSPSPQPAPTAGAGGR